MTEVSYPRFEYWQTGTQWYWHLQAANYRIIGASGGYDSEAGVKDAIRTFCQRSADASTRPAVHVYPPR